MSNKIYICAAIILLVCLGGVIIYTYFEIYPEEKTIYPSRETYNNSYLAAERWLEATGHNVRVIKEYSPKRKLTETAEKVVIVDPLMIHFEETEKIISWVRQGHFLVLCHNYDGYFNDSAYNDFLGWFGITVKNHEFEKTDEETETAGISIEEDRSSEPSDIPTFDFYYYFYTEPQDTGYNVITMKDNDDNIRLVEIQIGDGAITAVGVPVFMRNLGLKEKNNAHLTWALTGARTDETNMGILFLRQTNANSSKSLFGAVMERGNLKPVIVSALLLIFIGFWAVIPAFGLVTGDRQRNSRPIKDRFTAEIRFLKKYRALDYYMDTDKTEKKEYSYREIINQYWRKFDGNAKN